MVDVVDNGLDGLDIIAVAVIPAAFLPEAEGRLAGAFADRELAEQWVSSLDQCLLDPERDRAFDREEDVRDPANRVRQPGGRCVACRPSRACPRGTVSLSRTELRQDEQVHVFGHVDECKQVTLVCLHGLIDRVGEELWVVV